jgi:hypothetical protein
MSNRKVSINYTGLDGFGSLVEYCEDLMWYRWVQLLTDVFAHTLVQKKWLSFYGVCSQLEVIEWSITLLHIWCVTLSCSLGWVLLFRLPMEKTHYVTSYSATFLGASFSGTFSIFWEYLKWLQYFFFGDHEDILSWDVHRFGDHRRSESWVYPVVLLLSLVSLFKFSVKRGCLIGGRGRENRRWKVRKPRIEPWLIGIGVWSEGSSDNMSRENGLCVCVVKPRINLGFYPVHKTVSSRSLSDTRILTLPLSSLSFLSPLISARPLPLGVYPTHC